jgi:general stress protein YciG
MKKDAYYFSHDANARNDIKILRLRRQLGVEGYGIYFMVVEVLREQIDHKLPISSIPDLAYDFNVSEEKVKTVILSYDLFRMEDDLFFSERLLRSMEEYNSKKIKYVEAGRKGGQASVKRRLNIAQPLKESKGNEIKNFKEQLLNNEVDLSKFLIPWNLKLPEFKKMLETFDMAIAEDHTDYRKYKQHLFNWGKSRYYDYAKPMQL